LAASSESSPPRLRTNCCLSRAAPLALTGAAFGQEQVQLAAETSVAEDAVPGHPASPGEGKRDDFDLLHNSLGYAIKCAQVRTYAMYFEFFGEDALSPARMTALSYIGSHPGINQSTLAEFLGITRASAAKLIDSLESRHLIERRRVEGDRRSHALALTPEGHKELRALDEKTMLYEKAIASNLSPEERTTLLRLITKIAVRE
jgi:DNA-binding MarR family transcriptional regulator